MTVVLTLCCACDGTAPQAASSDDLTSTPVHGYDVVNDYPHDPDAYTQGLVFRDGFLFESTGLYSNSTLRRVALKTGKVLQRHVLDGADFGEGLADWDDSLLQLTWRSNVAFAYDLRSFRLRGSFPITGEGWGLTHDRHRLIMSDGTSRLRFMEPATFRELGHVEVHDMGRRVDRLNELEFVKGAVYANVWKTDRIAVIDPGSGRITAWIDLTGLYTPRGRSGNNVLNGIAYDAASDRLFVTGKRWPRVFEIKVIQR